MADRQMLLDLGRAPSLTREDLIVTVWRGVEAGVYSQEETGERGAASPDPLSADGLGVLNG